MLQVTLHGTWDHCPPTKDQNCAPPALEALRLNHWTIREAPKWRFNLSSVCNLGKLSIVSQRKQHFVFTSFHAHKYSARQSKAMEYHEQVFTYWLKPYSICQMPLSLTPPPSMQQPKVPHWISNAHPLSEWCLICWEPQLQNYRIFLYLKAIK